MLAFIIMLYESFSKKMDAPGECSISEAQVALSTNQIDWLSHVISSRLKRPNSDSLCIDSIIVSH